MARYIIEASHEGLTHRECVRLLKAFAQGGAHWLAKTEFGCEEGVHKSWIIVEADNDADARLLAPPVIRNRALVVKLKRYTAEEISAMHDTDEAE